MTVGDSPPASPAVGSCGADMVRRLADPCDRTRPHHLSPIWELWLPFCTLAPDLFQPQLQDRRGWGRVRVPRSETLARGGPPWDRLASRLKAPFRSRQRSAFDQCGHLVRWATEP